MKLASLFNGKRDGALAIVSRDLTRAVMAEDIAPDLLGALERWADVQPALDARYQRLQDGSLDGIFPFDPTKVLAPLPRASGWLDASAYLSHGRLMAQVFKVPNAVDFETVPLMYQGSSDDFLPGQQDMPMRSEADAIDFEAELGVITGDIKLGASAAEAERGIHLVVLLNDMSLRAHTSREMSTGFGWVHAKPTTSFSPVAVTLDELGGGWRDGRVGFDMQVRYNGRSVGHPNAAAMHFSFGALVAHAAFSRNLKAGTIVGSGTISNDEHARVGSACISEIRAIETLRDGAPQTPWMSFGDRVTIDMMGEDGTSLFGAIDQRIVPA